MKRQFEIIVMEYINEMCIESLPPDVFEKWDDVRDMLIATRNALKLVPISKITDEDAQQIGYDNAASFIKANEDYEDGIGPLSVGAFKYLIAKGYQI